MGSFSDIQVHIELMFPLEIPLFHGPCNTSNCVEPLYMSSKKLSEKIRVSFSFNFMLLAINN